MKFLCGFLAAILCICTTGAGLAGAEGQAAANAAPVLSEWAADPASCQPIALGNVSALQQLVQIGKGEPHIAAWSPDGERIALSTGTGVYLFDGHTLQFIGLLPSGYTRLMNWSQDGSLLALCSEQGAGDEIQVWDVAAMEKKYGVKLKRTVSDLRIDQQNNSLLALSQQQSGKNQYNAPAYKAYLDTYNLKTGKKKGESVNFTAKDKGLMNLSLSAGGAAVFGAGLAEMYLWNAKGKLIYSAPIGYPTYAIAVSGANVSVLLDLANMKTLQVVDRAAKQKVSDIALPKSVGRMVLNEETQEATLYTQTGYMLLDMETLEILADVAYPEKYAGDIWISGDRSRLVQIDSGVFRLVDLAAGSQLGEQGGFDGRAWQVAVGGGRLAASKGTVWESDTRLFLWNLDTLEPIAETGAPEFSATISDIFFLPDETELVTVAGGEDVLKLWNAQDGSKNRDIELQGKVDSAKCSADGSAFAVGYGGYAGVLPLADASSEKTFYMQSFVHSVSPSEDGSRIAACDGAMVIVWDAASQSELLTVFNEDAVSVALSADGERVAVLYSGKDNYTVKLIGVDTGKTLWTHKLTDNYQYMCFTPDGSMLAISAYQDGLVFVNAETGKTTYTLPYNVSDFSFSEDGKLLATASSDGSIRLWGVTGE